MKEDKRFYCIICDGPEPGVYTRLKREFQYVYKHHDWMFFVMADRYSLNEIRDVSGIGSSNGTVRGFVIVMDYYTGRANEQLWSWMEEVGETSWWRKAQTKLQNIVPFKAG